MILVVGSGFLGSYVLKQFAGQTREPVLGTLHHTENRPMISGVLWQPCDVTSSADLRALAERCGGEPLTVFYFAACHNIDYLYEHPSEAAEINITALQNFLALMPRPRRLFFASTDCVYGENDPDGTPLSESAPLCPVNVYGKQKAQAEEIVRRAGFTCVRLPYMLGPSLSAKPHFYDALAQKLQNGEPVEMIDGMYRSVLSYGETAALLYALARLPGELPPAVNVCGDRGYSKYEVGLRLAKKIGAEESLIKKISEQEGKKFFKDLRASSSVMDNTLLKRLLGRAEIQWEDGRC